MDLDGTDLPSSQPDDTTDNQDNPDRPPDDNDHNMDDNDNDDDATVHQTGSTCPPSLQM